MTAGQIVVDIRDGRFRRAVVWLHTLGPRALAEALCELGARRLLRTEIEALVERYSRVGPAALPAAGGDRWPR